MNLLPAPSFPSPNFLKTVFKKPRGNRYKPQVQHFMLKHIMEETNGLGPHAEKAKINRNIELVLIFFKFLKEKMKVNVNVDKHFLARIFKENNILVTGSNEYLLVQRCVTMLEGLTELTLEEETLLKTVPGKLTRSAQKAAQKAEEVRQTQVVNDRIAACEAKIISQQQQINTNKGGIHQNNDRFLDSESVFKLFLDRNYVLKEKVPTAICSSSSAPVQDDVFTFPEDDDDYIENDNNVDIIISELEEN